MPDERARGPASLRGEGVVAQPSIELWLAAGEFLEQVLVAERLRRGGGGGYRLTTRWARRAPRFSAALAFGGSSSASIS